jgi:hypothetical protein
MVLKNDRVCVKYSKPKKFLWFTIEEPSLSLVFSSYDKPIFYFLTNRITKYDIVFYCYYHLAYEILE